jgi:hypothetical protein
MTMKPRMLSFDDVGFNGQITAALHGSPKPCQSMPRTNSAATEPSSKETTMGFRAATA